MPAIGQFAQRDTEQGVKHAESCAVKKADLVVTQAQIRLYVFGEDGDDVAVDEIEDIEDDQNAQRIPAVGRHLGVYRLSLKCFGRSGLGQVSTP